MKIFGRIFNKFVVFSLVFALFGLNLQPRPPFGSMKATYSIFKDEYKRVSPLVGAIWWHSGLIKNIYRYSDESKPLTKLVKELFHEVPGQFGVTQNKKNPAALFSTTSVGKIIHMVEKGGDQLKKSLTNLILKDWDFRESFERSWDINFVLAHEEYCEPKNGAKKDGTISSKRMSEEPYFYVFKNITKLIDAIVGSCAASKDRALAVLLAFFYEKANKKEDFEPYIKDFSNDYFEKKIDDFSVWCEQAYEKSDLELIWKNHTERTALLGCSEEEYFYAQVMTQCFLVPFPDPTGYKDVDYKTSLEVNASTKTFSFPDCMETTMRDLCNAIVFCVDDFLFAPELRRQAGDFSWTFAQKEEVDRLSLVDFYQGECAMPSASGIRLAHEQWTLVVENRPLVAYNRISNISGGAHGGLRIEGFVPVKNLDEEIKKIEKEFTESGGIIEPCEYGGYTFTKIIVGEDKREYWLFDADAGLVGYEIMPSIRNTLVLLQKLFGLKFNEKKSSDPLLAQTILNEDFNSDNLKHIFAQLGFDDVNTGYTDIDHFDRKTELTITISKEVANGEKAKLLLHIQPFHGWVTVDIPETASSFGICDQLIDSVKKRDMKLENLQTSLLFALNKFSYKKMVKQSLHEVLSDEQFYQQLLCLNMKDDNALVDIAKELLDEELFAKLSDGQKSMVKGIWLEIVLNMPVLDGANQKTLVAALRDNEVFNKILFDPANKKLLKGDNFSESFLAIVLFCFEEEGVERYCDGFGWLVPRPDLRWDAFFLELALEGAASSCEYKNMLRAKDIFKFFINKETTDGDCKSAVALAKKIVKKEFGKKRRNEKAFKKLCYPIDLASLLLEKKDEAFIDVFNKAYIEKLFGFFDDLETATISNQFKISAVRGLVHFFETACLHSAIKDEAHILGALRRIKEHAGVGVYEALCEDALKALATLVVNYDIEKDDGDELLALAYRHLQVKGKDEYVCSLATELASCLLRRDLVDKKEKKITLFLEHAKNEEEKDIGNFIFEIFLKDDVLDSQAKDVVAESLFEAVFDYKSYSYQDNESFILRKNVGGVFSVLVDKKLYTQEDFIKRAVKQAEAGSDWNEKERAMQVIEKLLMDQTVTPEQNTAIQKAFQTAIFWEPKIRRGTSEGYRIFATFVNDGKLSLDLFLSEVEANFQKMDVSVRAFVFDVLGRLLSNGLLTKEMTDVLRRIDQIFIAAVQGFNIKDKSYCNEMYFSGMSRLFDGLFRFDVYSLEEMLEKLELLVKMPSDECKYFAMGTLWEIDIDSEIQNEKRLFCIELILLALQSRDEDVVARALQTLWIFCGFCFIRPCCKDELINTLTRIAELENSVVVKELLCYLPCFRADKLVTPENSVAVRDLFSRLALTPGLEDNFVFDIKEIEKGAFGTLEISDR